MQRIDSSGSINGRFSDGNPAIGQAATLLTAKWHNDIQEEVCNVIEQMNIDLDPNDQSQLYQAILAMVTGAVGAGGGAVPTTRLVNAGGLVTGGGDLAADRTLTVTAATPAEAQAGTRNDVALTPLAVAGAGRVLATAMNLPLIGGGIIKTGVTTVNANASRTVTFDVGFPTECCVVLVNGGNVSSAQQDNGPFESGTPAANAFTIFNAIDTTVTVRWFAIGY